MPSNSPQVIQAEGAPKAIGPYSQAQRVGNLVYTSGQIALDPVSGQMVAGGIEAETRRALTNLGAVLTAAGSGFGHVLKTTVFMQDLNEFAAMNGVYAEFFPGPPPARSTVQVAALPRAARLEIECVAYVPGE